ncbi:type IV pilin protein [Vibrio rumoiensis]|uniref:Type IV pilin protein n=1 Tax=Vibrio rumoiensis TaxID=76258 RepID=A0ABW7IVY1_9VIBR|nr:type IV pilin protein [Vibrio rumoiensis]
MIRINRCKKNSRRQKGMTLIELLIALAILGVLTAIAYPSYQEHVLKSHRASVMSDMMKIQLELEQHRTQSGSYDYTVVDNTAGTCNSRLGCQTDTDRYKLSITSGASGIDLYVIKATPQSTLGQDKDKCGTLEMNAGSVGSAKKGGVNVDRCWN